MSKLDFNDNEMAYLLLALRKHEESLLASEDDEAGDAVTDLLVIQALRRKIKEAKDHADG